MRVELTHTLSSTNIRRVVGELELLLRRGLVRRASTLRTQPFGTIPAPTWWSKALGQKGIPRGSMVAVAGAVAPIAELVGAATRATLWCAIVGMPHLSAAALARAAHVDLSRCVFLPHAHSSMVGEVAGSADVLVLDPGILSSHQKTTLAAKVRATATVAIAAGPWPGADLALRPFVTSWPQTSAGGPPVSTCRMGLEISGRRIVRPVRTQVTFHV